MDTDDAMSDLRHLCASAMASDESPAPHDASDRPRGPAWAETWAVHIQNRDWGHPAATG
jgi:hypothetical protein